MHLPDPTFPPLLTGHSVSAPDHAMDVAVRGAVRGEYGAGDIVWARNTSRLECALVLEPDVSPDKSVEMLFVSLVAFGDCFGALAPPEVPLTIRWPDTILVNGGRVGHVKLAMSAARDDDGAPRWLVLGLKIDLRRSGNRQTEPGVTPDITTLEEEGCGAITRTDFLESYSRHLLSWIHLWETGGFREVHESLIFRTEGRDQSVTVEIGGVRHEGRFTGLDEHGGMLLQTPKGMQLLEATAAVEMVDVEAAT